MTKIKKIKTWSSSKIDLEELHVFIFLIQAQIFEICVFFYSGRIFLIFCKQENSGKTKKINFIVETRVIAQMKGIFILIKSYIRRICQKLTFDPFLAPKAKKCAKIRHFERYLQKNAHNFFLGGDFVSIFSDSESSLNSDFIRCIKWHIK